MKLRELKEIIDEALQSGAGDADVYFVDEDDNARDLYSAYTIQREPQEDMAVCMQDLGIESEALQALILRTIT